MRLARSVANRVLRRLRSQRLPRIVTLYEFDPNGCRFEVTTPVERYRVVDFGGERVFTHLLLNSLRPDDILFDVGACVGLVSVHAAARCAQVVAFEPDPHYLSRLRRNLSLNNVNNVRVEGVALSNEVGTAVLFTDGVEGRSPSLRQVGERGEVQVETVTLDDYLERTNIWPSAIKMDIEGAEILALRGARRLLGSERAPRMIFLELHPNFITAFGSSTEEVKGLLRDHGYAARDVAEREDQLHVVYECRRDTRPGV